MITETYKLQKIKSKIDNLLERFFREVEDFIPITIFATSNPYFPPKYSKIFGFVKKEEFESASQSCNLYFPVVISLNWNLTPFQLTLPDFNNINAIEEILETSNENIQKFFTIKVNKQALIFYTTDLLPYIDCKKASLTEKDSFKNKYSSAFLASISKFVENKQKLNLDEISGLIRSESAT